MDHWNLPATGWTADSRPPIKVAVIDSGIQQDHLDMGGLVVASHDTAKSGVTFPSLLKLVSNAPLDVYRTTAKSSLLPLWL